MLYELMLYKLLVLSARVITFEEKKYICIHTKYNPVDPQSQSQPSQGLTTGQRY